MTNNRQIPEFPLDLSHLAEAYTKYQEENDSTLRAIYGSALTLAILKFVRTNEGGSPVAKCLVQCWFDSVERTLGSSKSMDGFFTNIDDIITIIGRYDLLASLLETEQDRRVIAHVFLMKTLMNSYDDRHEVDYPLYELLSEIKGISVTKAQVRDIPVMVNLLFGNGTWELYGGDVAIMDHVATYLYQQALPAQGLRKGTDLVVDSPTDLPVDLTP